MSARTLSSRFEQSTGQDAANSFISQTELPHFRVGEIVGGRVGGEGFLVGEGVVGTGASVGMTVMQGDDGPKQLSDGPLAMTM